MQERELYFFYSWVVPRLAPSLADFSLCVCGQNANYPLATQTILSNPSGHICSDPSGHFLPDQSGHFLSEPSGHYQCDPSNHIGLSGQHQRNPSEHIGLSGQLEWRPAPAQQAAQR